MREIVLDTETTGLDPFSGHRVVEIGCVELVNGIPSGQTFHRYLNPERAMPPEALAVHGLDDQFLEDKAFFAEVVDELIAFLGDAPLVIHALAGDQRPAGASNRLDDLCARYAIDSSRRTKHGALLDAELLAEVYVELIGARQAQLILSQAALPGRALGEPIIVRERPAPLLPRVTAEERAAHRAFIATLGEKAIWLEYVSLG